MDPVAVVARVVLGMNSTYAVRPLIPVECALTVALMVMLRLEEDLIKTTGALGRSLTQTTVEQELEMDTTKMLIQK